MKGYERLCTFVYQWMGTEGGKPTDELYSQLTLASAEHLPAEFWREHGDKPGLGGTWEDASDEELAELEELLEEGFDDEEDEDEWDFSGVLAVPMYFFYN